MMSWAKVTSTVFHSQPPSVSAKQVKPVPATIGENSVDWSHYTLSVDRIGFCGGAAFSPGEEF
jgi:hypothetical protein